MLVPAPMEWEILQQVLISYLINQLHFEWVVGAIKWRIQQLSSKLDASSGQKKDQINQLSSGLNQLNQAIQNIDVGDTKQLDSVFIKYSISF